MLCSATSLARAVAALTPACAPTNLLVVVIPNFDNRPAFITAPAGNAIIAKDSGLVNAANVDHAIAAPVLPLASTSLASCSFRILFVKKVACSGVIVDAYSGAYSANSSGM